MANIAVSIFVVLAGYNFLCSFFPYNILPVDDSISIAPSEASVKLGFGTFELFNFASTGCIYINPLKIVEMIININNIYFTVFIC